MSDKGSYAGLAIGFLALIIALGGIVYPETTPSYSTFAPYPKTNTYLSPSLIMIHDYSTQTFTSDKIRAELYITTRRIHIDTLAFYVTTAGILSKVRLGLYNDSGSVYPYTLLVDGGEVDTTSTGIKTVSVDVWVDAGYFWFVSVAWKKTAPPPPFGSDCEGYYNPLTLVHVISNTAYDKSFTYTSLPDPFPFGASMRTGNWWVYLNIDSFE